MKDETIKCPKPRPLQSQFAQNLREPTAEQAPHPHEIQALITCTCSSKPQGQPQ